MAGLCAKDAIPTLPEGSIDSEAPSLPQLYLLDRKRQHLLDWSHSSAPSFIKASDTFKFLRRHESILVCPTKVLS